MKIIKVSHCNLNAWLDFFDNRAFSDHKEWKSCYCTYYFYPKLENNENIGNSKREYAKLKRIIEDSKKDGTKEIEAYPNVKAKN
jgi:hypothetical protein